MLRAGLFTELIELYGEVTESSPVTGAVSKSWKKLFTARAYRKKGQGSHTVQMGEEMTLETAVLIVRRDERIKPYMRIKFNGTMWVIATAYEYNGDIELTIKNLDD